VTLSPPHIGHPLDHEVCTTEESIVAESVEEREHECTSSIVDIRSPSVHEATKSPGAAWLLGAMAEVAWRRSVLNPGASIACGLGNLRVDLAFIWIGGMVRFLLCSGMGSVRGLVRRELGAAWVVRGHGCEFAFGWRARPPACRGGEDEPAPSIG
jgi:hypothetical protein